MDVKRELMFVNSVTSKAFLEHGATQIAEVSFGLVWQLMLIPLRSQMRDKSLALVSRQIRVAPPPKKRPAEEVERKEISVGDRITKKISFLRRWPRSSAEHLI